MHDELHNPIKVGTSDCEPDTQKQHGNFICNDIHNNLNTRHTKRKTHFLIHSATTMTNGMQSNERQ